MRQQYKFLFGPVPSRRLGRSLGIDLTPFKTCSFDCIFCQLGRTTNLTSRRDLYVPLAEVKAELDSWLSADGQADIITLAGSGEPTLYSGFGEIIRHVKAHSKIPVAVLTNGSMLHLPEVRAAAAAADIVKISLSAWNDESLMQINRPSNDLRFEQILAGEQQFRREFKGQLWMEVFILDGINSLPEHVGRIAELAVSIAPDRIQLNTCVRPPAEKFASAVSQTQLSELAALFTPAAEVIAEFSSAKQAEVKASEEAVLDMLRRRPCPSRQIADVFGMHLNEVAKYLGKLVRTGQVKAVQRDDNTYYACVSGS